MLHPRDWLRQVWPRKAAAVVSDYLAVGTHKHFLADVLLRGNVYRPHPPTDSLYQAGVLEGRRQLAIEITSLAGDRPERLWSFIEQSEIRK